MGQPAAWDSSKKMYCSTGVKPFPPYSVGHPTPSQPSAPIFRISALYSRFSAKSALEILALTSGVINSLK